MTKSETAGQHLWWFYSLCLMSKDLPMIEILGGLLCTLYSNFAVVLDLHELDNNRQTPTDMTAMRRKDVPYGDNDRLTVVRHPLIQSCIIFTARSGSYIYEEVNAIYSLTLYNINCRLHNLSLCIWLYTLLLLQMPTGCDNIGPCDVKNVID